MGLAAPRRRPRTADWSVWSASAARFQGGRSGLIRLNNSSSSISAEVYGLTLGLVARPSGGRVQSNPSGRPDKNMYRFCGPGYRRVKWPHGEQASRGERPGFPDRPANRFGGPYHVPDLEHEHEHDEDFLASLHSRPSEYIADRSKNIVIKNDTPMSACGSASTRIGAVLMDVGVPALSHRNFSQFGGPSGNIGLR